MSAWKILTRRELPANPWSVYAAIKSLDTVRPEGEEDRERVLVVAGIVAGVLLACLFETFLRVVL